MAMPSARTSSHSLVITDNTTTTHSTDTRTPTHSHSPSPSASHHSEHNEQQQQVKQSKLKKMFQIIDAAPSTHITLQRLLVDALVFAVLILIHVYFKIWSPTYERGYWCDDQSIEYSYLQSTMPIQYVYIVAAVIFFILVLLTELHECVLEADCDVECSETHQHCVSHYSFLGRFRCHRFWVRLYQFTAYFAVGVFMNSILTHMLKHAVGRLRPNFIAVCQPSEATLQICAADARAYVAYEDVHCTGSNSKRIDEGHLSFPSGHTSFSFYFTVFMVLYTQLRARWRVCGSKLPLLLLQFALLTAASFVGASRIQDHKHHWSDVVGGVVVGVVVGLFVVIWYARAFSRPRHCTCATYAKGKVPNSSVRRRFQQFEGSLSHV